ncbi:hypothetical protein X753_20190 [Mesorhizobium sp. LNJC399B00]|nr:hypothetical protein X753_20190 [Mesorhizobium sp. LNJC399B00]
MARRLLLIYLNTKRIVRRHVANSSTSVSRNWSGVDGAASVHFCLVILANWLEKGRPVFKDPVFGSYASTMATWFYV